MKNLNQWVSWVWYNDTKVLKRPAGGAASSTNPDTWGAYDDVQGNRGFVLTLDDPYILIDLDHCLHDGKLDKWARKLVKKLDPGFVDISPSGDGVHIFIKGRLPETHRRKFEWKGHKIELYQEKRFVTMPEKPLIGSIDTVRDGSEAAMAFLLEVSRREAAASSVTVTKSDLTVKQVKSAMKEVGTWPKGYEDGEDMSSADYRFLHQVAKVTGPDPELIEAVWQASKLVREKTSGREQYHIDRMMLEHDWNPTGFDELPGKGLEVEVLPDIKEMIVTKAEYKSVLREIIKQRVAGGDVDLLLSGMARMPEYPAKKALQDELRSMQREQIDPMFPDWRINNFTGELVYLSTEDNMRVLLKKIGIKAYYDVIKKDIVVKGTSTRSDNWQTKLRSRVVSEAVKAGLPKCIIEDHFESIIVERDKNPLLKKVKSVKWDGKDRLCALSKAIHVKGSSKYKKEGLKRWLVQCVAAWDGAVHTPLKYALPKYELILVMQSAQGVKKTSFFGRLLPGAFGRKYFADGVALHIKDKDSILHVISHGIAELGELDATFKKSDIADIKSFTSKQWDKIRRPYGRDYLNYRRHTSMCASVNDENFLNDVSGARRFFVLALTKLDQAVLERLDYWQLWAQVWQMYLDGAPWWFEESEKWVSIRDQENEQHRESGTCGDIVREIQANVDKGVKPVKINATYLFESYTGRIPSLIERTNFSRELKVAGFELNKASYYHLPIHIKDF